MCLRRGRRGQRRDYEVSGTLNVPGRVCPDALAVDWKQWAIERRTWGGAFWLNPPYSPCRDFIAKASTEARSGCTVACLVPARTDTHWWHASVWDATAHQPRAGVQVRFIKGRLKFGSEKNCAPFPSVVIVFGRSTVDVRLVWPDGR